MNNQILAMSDIALGYGSPQIPALIQSVAKHYDTQALVIETDEPHRPPHAPLNCDRLIIKRSVSALPYWSMGAHCERNEMAIKYANEHKPSIFIFCSPLQLPIIKRLEYKPDLVILYFLEIDAVQYQNVLKSYSHLVDHIIAPEYNRLKYILTHYCARPYPTSHIIYNVSNVHNDQKSLPSHKRNGRVIYAGTLNKSLTLAHEFFEEPLNKAPIDIYGNFSGDGADELKQLSHNISSDMAIDYKGYVPASILHESLPHYAFSFTRWNPKAGLNFEYACPNKFFEALAYGVPPISAPHPQAVQIINKYKCGILASGFGAEHMAAAIQKAMSIYGTKSYDDMVINALKAYEQKFNWNEQFHKFAQSIKD